LPELVRDAAEDWIRSLVKPVAPIEIAHERPWSTVLRVPIRQGSAWFKACSRVQAFEPTLTANLYGRWPDRVAMRVGMVAHAIAWLRQRDLLPPESIPDFDRGFTVILRRALRRTVERGL
jgi:hypothetical protein